MEENILEENQKQSVFEQFENILENLNLFKAQISTFQQQIKHLEKSVKKEMKFLKKETIKQQKGKGNREPSGFAKPTNVSKELCEFMNKKEGTQIARTDVTKALISYININKLQNQENKKFIKPDNKLKTLLGVNENDELTYFTIQKYMNKHFTKKNDDEVQEDI
jgi:chromatin remodeling complex protein RSC6